jgi:hypothetical protein
MAVSTPFRWTVSRISNVGSDERRSQDWKKRRQKSLAWQNRPGAVLPDRRMLEPKFTWAFPHGKMMLFRDINLISIIMTRAPDLF